MTIPIVLIFIILVGICALGGRLQRRVDKLDEEVERLKRK